MRKMRKISIKRDNKINESGVTLMVLVVTVIILSILTGVSIYMGTTSIQDISDKQDMSVLNMVQEIVIAQYTKTQYLSQTEWKLSEHSTQPPSYFGECILTQERYIKLPNDNSSMFPSASQYVTNMSTASATYDDCYYRLDENVLKNLGITDSTEDDKDLHTYIVNYKTGEVYDETMLSSKFYIKGNKELVNKANYESKETNDYEDTTVDVYTTIVNGVIVIN